MMSFQAKHLDCAGDGIVQLFTDGTAFLEFKSWLGLDQKTRHQVTVNPHVC